MSSSYQDEEYESDERRRFHRFPFQGRARVFSEDSVWETRMIDISLNGILLERPQQWNGKEGQRYRIDVRLEGGIVISMAVSAVDINEENVRFRCERIDMDSFSHLKRLVELNLGAPELLNRELAALG